MRAGAGAGAVRLSATMYTLLWRRRRSGGGRDAHGESSTTRDIQRHAATARGGGGGGDADPRAGEHAGNQPINGTFSYFKCADGVT